MGFAIVKRRESLTTTGVSDYYSMLSVLSKAPNSFVGGIILANLGCLSELPQG